MSNPQSMDSKQDYKEYSMQIQTLVQNTHTHKNTGIFHVRDFHNIHIHVFRIYNSILSYYLASSTTNIHKHTPSEKVSQNKHLHVYSGLKCFCDLQNMVTVTKILSTHCPLYPCKSGQNLSTGSVNVLCKRLFFTVFIEWLP